MAPDRVRRRGRPKAEPSLQQELATAVRALRLEQNQSQLQLAEGSDLNLAVINRMERGLYSPTLATLESLARGLATCPSDLLRKAEDAANAAAAAAEEEPPWPR